MRFAAISVSVALMFGLTGAVLAGPESIRSSSKEMKATVVPEAPACPNWSGFYFGIQGGYVHPDADPDLTLDGAWVNDPLARPTNFWIPEGLAIIHQVRDLSTDGGSVGGLIGYNWQLSHHWVFGLEAAGSYLWLRDSGNTDIFPSPITTDTYRIAESFNTNYLFTFGPRLGYAFCRWMPYVIGGLAVGDIDFNQNIIETDPGANFQQGGRRDDTNVGWMVGAGLEYKLTNHWSIRGQYQYVDLDSVSFRHAGVPNVSNNATFTGRSSLDVQEHHATFGLIFGF